MPHNNDTGKATINPEPDAKGAPAASKSDDMVPDHLEPRGPAGWRLAGLLLFAAVIIGLLAFQVL